MRPASALSPRQRLRARLLCLLGVLAVLLHVHASAGMVGMGLDASGSGQVICTAQGLVSIDAVSPDGPSLSPHACCDLCGVCHSPAIGGGLRFDFAPAAGAPASHLAGPAAARAPPAAYRPQSPRAPPFPS